MFCSQCIAREADLYYVSNLAWFSSWAVGIQDYACSDLFVNTKTIWQKFVYIKYEMCWNKLNNLGRLFLYGAEDYFYIVFHFVSCPKEFL